MANHGKTTKRSHGTTIRTDYGMDNASGVTGSATDERISEKFGGGESDLSHSLSGTTAKQRHGS